MNHWFLSTSNFDNNSLEVKLDDLCISNSLLVCFTEITLGTCYPHGIEVKQSCVDAQM